MKLKIYQYKLKSLKKISLYGLYLTIVCYIALVLFTLTSCSSDDIQGPPTIAIPDANFEQALIDLGFDTNGVSGNILQTDAELVTTLDVRNKSINNLQGIEGFINLMILYCDNNQITSLDLNNNLVLKTLTCSNNQISFLNVANNTVLKLLSCENNQLTSLDISNNLVLEKLGCRDNQLTSLNLSNNVMLILLQCFRNQLENLNIKNGNNSNVTYFRADNNPNLTCIEVDDVEYSTNNWLLIDNTATYSNDCN